MKALPFAGLSATALLLAACGGEPASNDRTTAAPTRVDGATLTVRDTTIVATFDANGTAEPLQQATVSTKLMGTVTAVLAQEGDNVQAGQVLVRIDARDVEAKSAQVAASIADAEAMQKEAAAHAARFRALYADSAATRAQFDAAETGLARAEAGLRAARAGANELQAVQSYASVRAPFHGIVTMRFADPGSFAAPGAPLLTVQDPSTLRVSVSAPANTIQSLQRGAQLTARIDGVPVTATVEGIVPANAGGLFTVNATVRNSDGTLRAGSAAVLELPQRERRGLLIPRSALVRDGDLVGVIVRVNGTDDRRWIRVGTGTPTHVEVLSGLAAGDVIVVPAAPAANGAKAGV